jgi:hypothetical protein
MCNASFVCILVTELHWSILQCNSVARLGRKIVLCGVSSSWHIWDTLSVFWMKLSKLSIYELNTLEIIMYWTCQRFCALHCWFMQWNIMYYSQSVVFVELMLHCKWDQSWYGRKVRVGQYDCYIWTEGFIYKVLYLTGSCMLFVNYFFVMYSELLNF